MTARGHAVAALLELVGTRAARPRSRVVSVQAISFVAIAALSAATAGILVSYGPFARPRLVAQAQIKDVCCFDLSGGPNMNDGVVTVSRSGQVVDCVIVYEDRARTRALAAGDPLLFLSRKKECKEGSCGTRQVRENSPPRPARDVLLRVLTAWVTSWRGAPVWRQVAGEDAVGLGDRAGNSSRRPPASQYVLEMCSAP